MSPPRPHALLIPFPLQGHVRPFVQLAQCLSGVHGFKVTIANTSHTHKRLGRLDTSAEDDIHFVNIQDSIPDEYYTTQTVKTLMFSLGSLGPHLESFIQKIGSDSVPITCIISDFNFLEAHSTSIRLGIPSVGFSTQSAMSLVIKFHFQKLIDEGLLPIPAPTPISRAESVRTLQDIATLGGQAKVACARKVTCVPGLHPLRVGELHSVLVTSDLSSPSFQLFTTKQTESLHSRAWSLINTFGELEDAVLQPFQRDHARVNLLTVGPLLVAPTIPNGASRDEGDGTSSLFPEEVDCIGWLDKQLPNSVVYISFGSTTIMTPDMLEEFVLGLEDSQVPFLLVARPSLVDGGSRGLPSGFEERTKGRGLVVSWAPQLKVLGHTSTTGFVTHCGWNSLIESVSMGVPMLGVPFFADQAMNNRYVVEVWKTGLEFERRADLSIERHEVAKKVRMLASQDSELRIAAQRWKEAARRAVEHGGSSHNNLAAFAVDMYKRAQTNNYCNGSTPIA